MWIQPRASGAVREAGSDQVLSVLLDVGITETVRKHCAAFKLKPWEQAAWSACFMQLFDCRNLNLPQRSFSDISHWKRKCLHVSKCWLCSVCGLSSLHVTPNVIFTSYPAVGHIFKHVYCMSRENNLFAQYLCFPVFNTSKYLHSQRWTNPLWKYWI